MLNIKIEGIGRLEAELNSIGSSIADTLEDAVMAGGMIIADEAEENIAPYRTIEHSGNLASSTGSPPRINRLGKYRVEGRIGPRNLSYGKIQEFGGLTGRGHRTRIQGKFYMTRAVASHQRQAEEEMTRVISEGFNR